MNFKFNDEQPIFLQISESIEDAILIGAYEEEKQIPSTTELSQTLKINPATALKGINLLVQEGIIYKKRGIGMFVSSGSVKKLKKKRESKFYNEYIVGLAREAKRLGLSMEDIIELIKRGYNNETSN